ncbi:MAG: alpha/beta fold hydrolase [Thermodesulfobacteriota bacterium]
MVGDFRRLYPFQSRFLNLDGLRYHYLDEGQGEPVVMLHGNPTWSFYFRNMVRGLSSNYRCIVPDHMGCGLSDKPGTDRYGYRLQDRVADLEKLVNHLAIDQKISLMVHDWGGMIGMVFALRRPERIHRLIITNTAGFFPPKQKGLPLRLWLIRHLRPLAVPAVLGLNLFARSALYMAPRKPLSPEVKAGLIAPYDSPRHRIATLKFVQDIPVAKGDSSYDLVKWVDEGLHRLAHLPILLLWGRHDFVFDTDYLAEWRRRFPRAESRLFSDGGHYLLEDQPDAVLGKVKDFLKKHPS